MNVLAVHRAFSPSPALNAMAARLEALVAKWPPEGVFDCQVLYLGARMAYAVLSEVLDEAGAAEVRHIAKQAIRLSQAFAGRHGERGSGSGTEP